MRELNCTQLKYEPNLVSEAEDDIRIVEKKLEEYNVNYLVKCLEIHRNTCYVVEGKPDEENRQESRPDFLFKELDTDTYLAIEHTRLFASEEAREQDVYIVRKNYDNGIIPLPMYLPTPQELADRLTQAVNEKLNKGQFCGFAHTECILLIRNKWNEVRTWKFHEAEKFLKLRRMKGCDHCFVLLLSGTVLEVF